MMTIQEMKILASDFISHPLSRGVSDCERIGEALSDATAIIAAKDAEIEQHRNNIAEFIRDADKKEETLRAEVERLTRERELITQAVRWAPSSAYWSNVLRDLCGLEARDGINHLESQAREYREQLAAAQKDSERLDHLATLFEHSWNGVMGLGAKTFWRLAGDYRHRVAKMVGKTFREAIDAARKEGE